MLEQVQQYAMTVAKVRTDTMIDDVSSLILPS